MAIPYNVPPLGDVQADYMRLDILLTELFAVLARILESRGRPSSELSSAILTLRRPAHYSHGGSSSQQTTGTQSSPVHHYNRHGSVSDETTSEDELDVAAGTSDAEDPLSPPQVHLPDILSHLIPARHTADCVCLIPASCRPSRKFRKVVRTPSKKTKGPRTPKTKRTVTVPSSSPSPPSSSSESHDPARRQTPDAPVC